MFNSLSNEERIRRLAYKILRSYTEPIKYDVEAVWTDFTNEVFDYEVISNIVNAIPHYNLC